MRLLTPSCTFQGGVNRMEKEFVVIVDSMADFEIGYSNPNLVVVETPVMIGGEDYSLKPLDEFYKRQKEVFSLNNQLRRDGKCPVPIKTSCPNPARIEEEMRKILETGRDAIYVATASTLTSAFQSGRLAVDMVMEDGEYSNKAICIDGLSMSALTAVLVKAALKMCDTTYSFLRFIYDRRNDTEHLFTVTEWDAFRDSGRISKSTLAIAELIGFKPMMRFDYDEEGTRKAFCAKKSRQVHKLYEYAINLLKNTIDGNDCMIIHAQNSEGAIKLCEMLAKEVPDLNISFDPEFSRMGQATGVHLGYSAIGLGFLRKRGALENAESHRKQQMQENSIYGYPLI